MGEEILLYTRLKAKLKNPDILTKSLRADYEHRGHVDIVEIPDDKTVFVTTGCGWNRVAISNLIPIYDPDIETTLVHKKRELETLEKEIRDIENFINKKMQ